MQIDFLEIENKLQNTPYDEALGIRLVPLQEASISGKVVELLAVKLDPGK